MRFRVTVVVLALLQTLLPGPSAAADGFRTRFLDIPARDGVALSGGQTVTVTAIEDAEIVLVDAA